MRGCGEVDGYILHRLHGASEAILKKNYKTGQPISICKNIIFPLKMQMPSYDLNTKNLRARKFQKKTMPVETILLSM